MNVQKNSKQQKLKQLTRKYKWSNLEFDKKIGCRPLMIGREKHKNNSNPHIVISNCICYNANKQKAIMCSENDTGKSPGEQTRAFLFGLVVAVIVL